MFMLNSKLIFKISPKENELLPQRNVKLFLPKLSNYLQSGKITKITIHHITQNTLTF